MTRSERCARPAPLQVYCRLTDWLTRAHTEGTYLSDRPLPEGATACTDRAAEHGYTHILHRRGEGRARVATLQVYRMSALSG